MFFFGNIWNRKIIFQTLSNLRETRLITRHGPSEKGLPPIHSLQLLSDKERPDVLRELSRDAQGLARKVLYDAVVDSHLDVCAFKPA